VSFATTMGGTATLHCSVDLLMSFQVVELRIDTPVDDGMTQAQSQQYSSKVLHSLQEESTGSGWAQFIQGLTFFVLTVFAAISFLMSLPVSTATMYGLFAALIVTWGAWVDVLLLGLYAQVISWEFVLGLLSYWLEIVTGVCIETTAMLVLAAGICRMFISEKWGEFKAAVKWAVISIALNLVLALATFYLFVFIYERSVDQFRRQQ
ncbi:MAG: hypothetical protein HXY34_12830, partial [Candidatus Thorarchaeota archaeon]|nr:hypothetical protein [Candidatus Thorarchaeota archaeon]